ITYLIHPHTDITSFLHAASSTDLYSLSLHDALPILADCFDPVHPPVSRPRIDPRTRDGRPVRRSTASAIGARARPRLMPIQRSGSGSHSRERWPTKGRRVRSVASPATRSARVRPARLDEATPWPTYPPARRRPVAGS